MSTGNPARRGLRRLRHPLFGVVIAVLVAIALDLAITPSAALLSRVPAPSVTGPGSGQATIASPPQADQPGPHDGPGLADGAVPERVTVFEEDLPAVARLDPALLDALRRAATRASVDGIEVVVNSGWRSAEHQQRLLDEAILEHGSREEAARWVATPETSAHVTGEAIDIGPRNAASWMARHGAPYGICQIYRNEPWHLELRIDARYHGCPAMYEDATHDPRMKP